MKRKHMYIVSGILLVLFIIGSFFDLQIAQSIYSKNNGFGLAMSAFSTIPGYGLLAFLGGALFIITKKNNTQKKWIKIILYCVSILCFAAATYFSGNEVFSENSWNITNLYWLGFVICGVIMVPVFYLGVYMGKQNTNEKMWILILVLLAVVFISLVPGVTLIKSIFHRPRYRIVDAGYVDFHNWWVPCSDYKDLISHFSELTKEEFKSFPSGHAGATTLVPMFLVSLCYFDEKLQKHQTLMFYIGFAYTALVMFSRMLVGAHYLSDVSMGALLVLICWYIGNEIIVNKLLPKKDDSQTISV